MNEVDYLLTIFNINNNKSHLYEITIKGKLVEYFIETFNDENERRIENLTKSKFNSIESDLTDLCNHFRP